jgi:hypothetical protein
MRCLIYEFVGYLLNIAGLDSPRSRERIKAEILPQSGSNQQCFWTF